MTLSLAKRKDRLVKTDSPDKSEIIGILLRIFAGALTVGLLIVLPALQILSAAWA